MTDLTKFLEDLKDIDAKKAANTKVQKKLESAVTDDAITELETKFSRHSKINNYALNILFAGLISLAGLSLAGYLRLDDKLDSESRYLAQRLDNLQQVSTQRLDEEIRFNTKRLDEGRCLNTERLEDVSKVIARKNLKESR